MPRENFVGPQPTQVAQPNSYGWFVPSPLTGETVGTGGWTGHIFRCRTPTGATITHTLISSPVSMTVHFGIAAGPIVGVNNGTAFWLNNTTPGSPASLTGSKFFISIEGGLGPEYFIGEGITRVDLQFTMVNNTDLVCAPRIDSNLFRVTWYWSE